MKLFGLLLAICTLQERTLALSQDGFAFKTSICDGKNGGLLPIFGTCSGYYVCADGKAVVGSCDPGTLFNPITLHCDAADKVECIFDAKDNKSSDESSSDSEEDSEETYQTDAPVTVKPTKPPVIQETELSDISQRMCLGKKDGVMLIKKGSCGEYYVCKSKKPRLRSCPAQQHFSPTRRICMKASEAKCSAGGQDINMLDKPAVTGGLCPEDKENSLAAHQSECGKFLLCSNMMFLVMDCPVGLHFNVASSRCDYPKIANCQVKKKETKSKTKSKKNGRRPKARVL
ncbi:hypothetical protein KR059_008720 [Drosophila kikkawai]|nr:hypothetical protein KR059_008720 [Drosophila kikkawai]